MKVLHISQESLRVGRELDMTDDFSYRFIIIFSKNIFNVNSRAFEYVAAWKAASLSSRVIAQQGSVWACSKVDMTSVSRDLSHLK